MTEDPIYEQNYDGTWSEAVPLPFLGMKKGCQCGQKFWRLSTYREHYKQQHTDGLAYNRVPAGMVASYRTHMVPSENHRLRHDKRTKNNG